jgi:hypothetical protein
VYEWTAAEIVDSVEAALASGHQGTFLALKDRLDAFNNYGSLVCGDSH